MPTEPAIIDYARRLLIEHREHPESAKRLAPHLAAEAMEFCRRAPWCGPKEGVRIQLQGFETGASKRCRRERLQKDMAAVYGRFWVGDPRRRLARTIPARHGYASMAAMFAALYLGGRMSATLWQYMTTPEKQTAVRMIGFSACGHMELLGLREATC